MWAAVEPILPGRSEVVWNLVSSVLLLLVIVGVFVIVRSIMRASGRQRGVGAEVAALRARVDDLERANREGARAEDGQARA